MHCNFSQTLHHFLSKELRSTLDPTILSASTHNYGRRGDNLTSSKAPGVGGQMLVEVDAHSISFSVRDWRYQTNDNEGNRIKDQDQSASFGGNR